MGRILYERSGCLASIAAKRMPKTLVMFRCRNLSHSSFSAESVSSEGDRASSMKRERRHCREPSSSLFTKLVLGPVAGKETRRSGVRKAPLSCNGRR